MSAKSQKTIRTTVRGPSRPERGVVCEIHSTLPDGGECISELDAYQWFDLIGEMMQFRADVRLEGYNFTRARRNDGKS